MAGAPGSAPRGDLAETSRHEQDNRLPCLLDLAAKGSGVRQAAHEALADELLVEQVETVLEDDRVGAPSEGGAVVAGATLQVYLPDEQTVTVRIGTRGGTGPRAGWTTWSTPDRDLPPLTAYGRLEIHAALAAIAELVTEAVTD